MSPDAQTLRLYSPVRERVREVLQLLAEQVGATVAICWELRPGGQLAWLASCEISDLQFEYQCPFSNDILRNVHDALNEGKCEIYPPCAALGMPTPELTVFNSDDYNQGAKSDGEKDFMMFESGHEYLARMGSELTIAGGEPGLRELVTEQYQLHIPIETESINCSMALFVEECFLERDKSAQAPSTYSRNGLRVHADNSAASLRDLAYRLQVEAVSALND